MLIRRIINYRMVNEFLFRAGASLVTFRYFHTRPTTSINGHLVTLLGIDKGIIVGYGHLDPEGGKTWLGICIAEGWTGSGRGSAMMKALLEFADRGGILLNLTVDSTNFVARRMYEKNGFMIFGGADTILYKREPRHG